MLRWLPTAFNSLLPSETAKIDFYPEPLRSQIDSVTGWLQSRLTAGVFRAGFARTQEAYEAGIIPLFAALNKLEALLASNSGPYILGKQITELDLLAYTIVVRFDTAYVQHFKTNLGTIRHDFPIINNWLKNLYWNVKGFRESTDFKHIKEGYTKGNPDINPLAITPLGPYPEVEEDYEDDWGNLKKGRCNMPAVLEAEKKM